MKVYYLRVPDSDFTKYGDTWISPVIDLYDNSTYKNYCTTRIGYGQNLLGDGTWTGMDVLSAGVTDSGYISGNRFVDTSARVDIISYTFDAVPDVDGVVDYTLDVFSAEVLDATPTWTTPVLDVGPHDNLNIFQSNRYVYFSLSFNNRVNLTFTGELLVRVEIDKPVIAPFFRRSRIVMDKLPEWMSMREIDNNPATPELGKTETVGGGFINSAGGEWLERLAGDLIDLDLQHYIGTGDLNVLAWVYKKPEVPDQVWSVVGDGVQLAQVFDQAEFYEAFDDDDVYFWNETLATVYVRKNYTNLVVNGITSATPEALVPHHIWNWLDDIGITVDLERLLLETNENFQLRILDVYINFPGVGLESFRRTLRRELDIWSVYGSTPNSNFLGATPVVLEMSDIEKDPVYITPEGLPTEKFIHLAEKLAEDYPSTWGFFYWNKAFWDFGGPRHQGYSTLPNRYDATPLWGPDTQSGVGHADDMFVHRPDVVTGPHQFDATLKIRGRERVARTEYTETQFDVEVYGAANRVVYDNPIVPVWLTAEVVTSDDATTYAYSFQTQLQSDADPVHTTGTANSYKVQNIFDDDGFVRLPIIAKSDGHLRGNDATPHLLHVSNVTSIKLVSGRWDVGTQTYVNAEVSDTFRAWFTDDEAHQLTYSSGLVTAIDATLEPSIFIKTIVVNATTEEWHSEPIAYHISLNGEVPDLTVKNFDLAMPYINWDPYLTGSPNKHYVIHIATHNNAATPHSGAFAYDKDGNRIFLSDSYIYANGSNTWSSGQQSFAIGTTTVTFSTGTGADYPIAGETWSLFEAVQVAPFAGIVDENGPWRSDVPPQPGNTSFNWKIAELDRNDFGIPNTTDWVPTWIGVEADDPQVIVWLANNTIHPVHDNSTLQYPTDAIDEFLDSGVYGFESFVIKARLRPDPTPEWNPQVNSGWFYEDQDEYYMYAARKEAVVTGASSVNLVSTSHQGAPIIAFTNEATPKLLRRIAFYQDATPSLQLTTRELVQGNGTNTLYLSYPDVYGVTVTEKSSGNVISAPTSTATNHLVLSGVTDEDFFYEVSYTVNNSFYADMNYDNNGTHVTRIVFDKVGDYTVNYEGSVYNPATPVNLPLSPLYTSLQEGFIYISHDEFALEEVQVYLNPGKLIANGEDYIQVTLHSVDQYGNPKGNQSFNLSSTFGTFDHSTITTDRDGFASVLLVAGGSPPVGTLTGTITVSGGVSAVVHFDVEPVSPMTDRLLAITSSEEIPADGLTKLSVFGKVEDTNFQPRASTVVKYRRGRSLFELFHMPFQGQVVTNVDGEFTVGPFTAATPTDPGYWFLSLETDSATPSHYTGDVVFWHEYPVSAYGIDNLSGLPRPANQMATPVSAIPPYALTYQFPYTYDEQNATPAPRSGIVPIWVPPPWYPMPWYQQYQLGLFGATPNHLSYNYLNNARPPLKDV